MSPFARPPPKISYTPVALAAGSTPEPGPVSSSHCLAADGMFIVRNPEQAFASQPPGSGPADATAARPEAPLHEGWHIFDPQARAWRFKTMRGGRLPDGLSLAALDSTLLLLAPAPDGTPFAEAFVCSLDDLAGDRALRREKVVTAGPRPRSTHGHATALERRGLGEGALWVVGGRAADGTRLIHVHALDWSSRRWTAVRENEGVGTDAPAARDLHSAVFHGGAVWVFGGRSDAGCLDDLGVLDAAKGTWSVPQAAGDRPRARQEHTAALLDPLPIMAVVGGVGESGAPATTTALLDLITITWSSLETGAVPRRVAFAPVAGQMLLFGGVDVDAASARDMSSLDLSTFDQRACLDLRADPTAYVAVKATPSFVQLRKTFTVEAWILARSFPPYATIVSRADGGWKTGFGLAKYGAGKGDVEEVPQVNFWLTPGYSTTRVQAQIEPNKWTHIAGTYDGTEMRLFIDGSMHDTLDHPVVKDEEADALHHPKADLCIGAHPNKAAWDGCIDVVRVWCVARTEDQIKATMFQNITEPTDNLIGAWSFNEGGGTLAVDASGNKHHGIFEGDLRRVPSDRPLAAVRVKTASEKHVDDLFDSFQAWAHDFEKVPAART